MINKLFGNWYSAQNTKYIAVKYFLLFLIVVWCVGFLFPVITPAFNGKPIINQILSYNYSLVCHQSENAAIHFGNEQLLVCARCAGIYIGALFIAIAMLFNLIKFRLTLNLFFLFTFPLIFDAITVRLSIYPYSKYIAFITGLLCGAIIFLYILDTLKNSFSLQYRTEYELQ